MSNNINIFNQINKKINNKKAVVAVVGLGYVGLPLCERILNLGYKVYGIDTDQKKINLILNKKIYIPLVNNSKFVSKINKSFSVSSNYNCINKSDIIIICVPTPLYKNYKPDLTPLKSTYNSLKKYLKTKQLLIIESSTYPGCTNDIFFKLIKNKFLVGEDFFLGYSPEREDPGNKKYNISNITKITSGKTKNCRILTDNFYRKITKTKIVSSIETAEFTKLYENVYRSINIALANESKMLADKLKLNIDEIITAAATKPFGFSRFEPGPGVGGHCIPIDPFYLSWIAKNNNVNLNLTNSAAKINFKVTKWLKNKILYYLKNKIKKKKPKIFIIGAAYKKNTNDLRMSPTLYLIKELKKKIHIYYNDNYVKEIKTKMFNEIYNSVSINKKNLRKADITVIMTDHDYLKKNQILKESKVIFDSRNLFKINHKKIYKV